MKNPRINCPRCNSLQRFGQQKRKVDEDQYEIFVRCQKCRWEKVVISGNSSIIHNTREIERLRIRAIREPQLRSVIKRKERMNEQFVDATK